MSTPIEIVKAQNEWWKRGLGGVPPHYREEYSTALSSVLRDAERFAALERAITDDKIFVSAPDPHDDDLWAPHDGTLSELADRLKGTQ